ncbi:MAG: phospholipase D-like domain-containing protein [Bacillota bacterium]
MEQELLINAKETFTEIIKQIKKAKKSILICMYIWRDDKIGNLIAKELLQAANRGVKIKIVKDKAGSVFEKIELDKQSFFHKQKDLISLIKGKFLSLLYYRDNKCPNDQLKNNNLNRLLEHKNIQTDFNQERHDHSKYFIFDDQILILGGINIGNKNEAEKAPKYRDYMVKLKGKKIVSYFYKRAKGEKSPDPTRKIEFYFNIRQKKLYEIKSKILELLEQAQYSIDLEMAYFGDSDITDKIIESCQRGIAVSIITSKNSNVQNDLNNYVLKKLIKKTDNNLRIYLSKELIHSKFICIDQNTFFIGSANFHKLGMESLSELNVLIKNSSVIQSKWKKWQAKHLRECDLIAQENSLNYNKLIALTEKVLC